MKTSKILLALFTVFIFSLDGYSQLTEWRTQVQVSAGSGVGTQFGSDGGLNFVSSSQTIDAGGGNGTAVASASLSSGGYIPTLRARATASPTRTQAAAWGVQGYENTSGSVINTSLSLDLSATITGANDIDARVYLFKSAGFDFNMDPGTMLFESSSVLWDGFDTFANNLGPTGFDIDINNFTGTVTEQRSFDFSVAPGESFYVWARLVTTADNTGTVDAFSTLTASLSNTIGLTPSVVPEPGTISLLLLGAVTSFFYRRRKN